jgi:anti-sigma factor RsiW
MTCDEVRRRLDEGRPGDLRTAQHLASCDACAREHRAALELDALLAVVVPVEADVADAVLEQIRPRTPWWVDVAAEPLIPASIALAAILGAAHRPLASALANVEWTAAAAGALAAILLGGSWQIFKLFRRMTVPGA